VIKRKLAATALLAATLAACGATQGSSPVTPTVTVTVPATPTSPTAVAPPQRTTSHTTSTVTSTPPTRTAPAPAFTRTTGGTPAAGGDLQAAAAKVHALGFTPLSTSVYDPNQTLRVLVGARTGSADAHTQQAFFFDGTRYLGTDASATSGQIAVAGHGDTDVRLRYAIYRPSDPDCCPTGTPRTVDFTLDGGHLVAADPIPAVADRR
jgi:hypothetical protein